MAVQQLSRLDARRIAVRAQLLDGRPPTGLLDVVRQLSMLQIDPIAAVAPNADLVAWSRLGSSYLSSTISWRCTSRPPSAGGGTSRCRSWWGIGWSASSMRPPTEGRAVSGRAIHQDVPFDAGTTAAVHEEIKDLSRWLQLELTLPR